MILDERTEFADAVSVAGAAGTAILGDVIDLGVAGRDIGAAEHLFFDITVDTAIVTAGSAGTIRFQLVSAPTATITTNTVVHYDSGPIATGAAAAGLTTTGAMLAQIGLPMRGNVYSRYLGVLVIVGTTSISAGAVSAFLTPDKHNVSYYADGVS